MLPLPPLPPEPPEPPLPPLPPSLSPMLMVLAARSGSMPAPVESTSTSWIVSVVSAAASSLNGTATKRSEPSLAAQVRTTSTAG